MHREYGMAVHLLHCIVFFKLEKRQNSHVVNKKDTLSRMLDIHRPVALSCSNSETGEQRLLSGDTVQSQRVEASDLHYLWDLLGDRVNLQQGCSDHTH